jgi:hypothetical protein
VEHLAVSLAHFAFLSSSRYRSDTKKSETKPSVLLLLNCYQFFKGITQNYIILCSDLIYNLHLVSHTENRVYYFLRSGKFFVYCGNYGQRKNKFCGRCVEFKR